MFGSSRFFLCRSYWIISSIFLLLCISNQYYAQNSSEVPRRGRTRTIQERPPATTTVPSSTLPTPTVVINVTHPASTNSSGTSAPIKIPRFPNISAPTLDLELVDQAFKSAQRRVIDFQSTENAVPARNGTSYYTAIDLFNIESQLTEAAKRDSQIAYILEGMTLFVANRSKLRREQIIFGLPQQSAAHPTITRRCPYNVPVVCNITQFRSINGLCNNMQNPYWGVSATPYSRFLPHNYSDAVWAIRTDNSGGTLSNARYVSASVHWPLPGTHPHVSQLLATWAQFVDHDVSHSAEYTDSNLHQLDCCDNKTKSHPECYPLDADPNDSYYDEKDAVCMNYVRSAIAPKLGCALGPRDQVNQATHFLDASQLYGNTEQDAQRLREFAGGRLWMTDFENGKSLLPEAANSTDCRPSKDPDTSCFDSGDKRVNENLPLVSLYTIWAREHNRLTDLLAKLNSHWDDEQLFQTARKIVIAEIQHITFTEFLPLVLGHEGISRHRLGAVAAGYFRDYSINNNPGIANEFATAAFKFWHTLMENGTQFIDRRGRTTFKPLNTQWFQPYDLYFSGVLDGIIRGIAQQPARQGDQSITSALTSGWLKVGDLGPNLDLAAYTIQRGRDHGLSSYNAWRDVCGFKRATSFDDLRDSMSENNVQILKTIYTSVNDIDLYTGGLCEQHVTGGLVGPVFACIIGKQFHNVRSTDRYWYENDMPDSGFSTEQLAEIRETTLARVICDNGDNIPALHPHVFRQPDGLLNALVPCHAPFYRTLDLTLWKEGLPEEADISRDILLNIIEKARDQVQTLAMDDMMRAQVQIAQFGRRTAFNTPNAAVRALHLESSVFLQGTKHIMKRQFPNRSPSNMTSMLARIRRFNGLIKAKLEGPPENASCVERLLPCDHTTKYRTMSGWCNNLNHPDWGSSERIFGRLVDPAFSDGVDEPRNMSVTGVALPTPRDVQINVVIDMDRPHPRYTHMLMQFGQLLDHDMTLTPIATALNGFNFNCRQCSADQDVSANCRPIPIPLSDQSMPPFVNGTSGERRCLPFIRSATGRTAFGTREQVNQNTAYVDGSVIYGSSLCKTQRLRSFVDGKLNSTKHSAGLKDLLPNTIDPNDVEFLECKDSVPGNMCFLSGDTRENESPGLTVSHTLWMRFHNDIAESLKEINPHWNDETLFQESRRILVAVFQHIAFNEFLPRILGEAVATAADLRPRKDKYYTDYDPSCDATLANEFSAAAFRFGHTLVQGEFGRYDNNFIAGNRTRVRLMEHFARGDLLYEDYGVDQLLIGLTLEPMQNMDFVVTKALTDHLFEDRGRKFSGQDLVAINIMRGRDHGVPGYNEFREYCNLTRAADFSDLLQFMPAEAVDGLAKLYKHVDDIDLYVAGISEFSVYGGVAGPTFACLIAEQFFRTRRCDRFWHETNDPLLRFTEEQLANIRQMRLAKVYCDLSDTMDRIQRSIFDLPDPYLNPHISCDDLPGLNFDLWKDTTVCNVSNVMIPMGKSQRVTPCLSCTCTKEGPFCQSMAVRNCRQLISMFPSSDLMADSVCKAQCPTFLRDAIKDQSVVRAVSDLFAVFS